MIEKKIQTKTQQEPDSKEASLSQKILSKIKIFFFERSNFSLNEKLKSSLWAILFAFAIVSLIINVNGFDSTEIYGAALTRSFSTAIGYNLRIYLLYMFAGLATALSFRSGFFNIGVPGQMTMGGGLGLLYLFSEISRGLPLTIMRLLVSLLIAILVGAAYALISGVLKTYLRIDEVVSTILLNWIAYYLLQYVFVRADSSFYNVTTAPPASKTLSTLAGENNVYSASSEALDLINNLGIVYGLIAFIIVILIITFFVLQKTTWGYRLRLIGLNRDASSYSGSNEKGLVLTVFFISGLLAGFAGWIWIIIFNSGSIVFEGSGPIIFGFDAISVTLIAFNGPVAIIFSALLYSSLFIGFNNLTTVLNAEFLPLANEFSFIFVGFIIIFIAAGTIFAKFKPLSYLQGKLLLIFYSPYYSALTKREKLKLPKNYQQKPELLLLKEQSIREQNLKAWEMKNYGFLKMIWLHFKLEYCFFKVKYRLASQKAKRNQKAYQQLKKSLTHDFDQIALKMRRENKKKVKLKTKKAEPQQELAQQNLETLLELSKKRLVINQKLSALGYFEKTNLRNEFRSKVFSLWRQLLKYRETLNLEYQKAWKLFWKDFKKLKDFKKIKTIHYQMLDHKKNLKKDLQSV